MPPGAHLWDSMVARGTVPALVSSRPNAEGPSRWYTPDSGLYRAFAELDGSEAALVDFANRYGELGGEGDEVYDRKDPWFTYHEQWEAADRTAVEGELENSGPEMPDSRRIECRAETLHGWWMEISAMRMCIDLHDMLRSAAPVARLGRHFSYRDRTVGMDDDEKSVFLFNSVAEEAQRRSALWSTEVWLRDARQPNADGVMSSPDPDDPGFYYYYQVRTYRKAEYFGFYEIRGLYTHEPDDDISEFTTTMLSAVVNAHLTTRVDTELLIDPRSGQPVLFAMPTSLIGAMWLQLAQAVDGNKDFRQCVSCRAWFELAPDKARADKLYCSQACRSRAYRTRRGRVTR